MKNRIVLGANERTEGDGVKTMYETEGIANRLKAMKSGDCVAALASGPEPQAVFLVKERSAVIKYFGNTGVEVRAAQFTLGPVAVSAIAFRLGQTVQMVYAVLLDFHGKEGSDMFQVLGRQEYIPLYFYGDNGRRERTFIVMNHLQSYFTDIAAAMQAMPGWHVDDFLAAAVKLTNRFPTPGDLWLAMQ